MGLELEAPTGASVGASASAYHRVRSCSLAAERAGRHAPDLICARVWVWPTHHGHPPRKTGRFSGQDFPFQPDGTPRCPAGKPLHPHERRREADGSLRVVYATSIRSCRPCPLREQCQWQGGATKKPRQVSVLLHPLVVGNEPLFWYDWSRRYHRRVCMQRLRQQRVDIQLEQGFSTSSTLAPASLSRAQRAHYRLAWSLRLARNAHVPTAGRITLKLFGIPEAVAASLGLATA